MADDSSAKQSLDDDHMAENNFFKKVKGAGKLFFWDDRQLRFFNFAAVFLNLVIWGGLFYLVKNVGKTMLIVRYNSFLGIDEMMDLKNGISWEKIYILPLATAILLIFDWLLGFFLMYQSLRQEEVEGQQVNFLTGKLIGLGGLITQAAVLIFVIALWRVNS